MRIIGVLLVLAALWPADAFAGDVFLRRGCTSGAGQTFCFPNAHVVFRDSSNQVNRVTVIGGPVGATIVRDDAQPIDRVPPRCERIDAHAVRCDAERDTLVYLGGGDDVLTVDGYLVAWGGTGNDQLNGFEWGDQLSGNDGDDVITGGDSYDELEGGAGSDTIDAGAGDDTVLDGETNAQAAPDTFAGGQGDDTIAYGSRASGVTIDLAAGRGAEDALAGFEDATGGSGDDTLLAAASGSQLYGAAGDDFLQGGAGPDQLIGLDGADAYDAGGGDDTIDAQQTTEADGGERVVCGEGADRVSSDDSDVLGTDCDLATLLGLLVSPRPAIADGVATFRFARSVRGAVVLRGPEDARFGRARVRQGVARVRLSPAAVAALAAGVLVRVSGRSDHGGIDGFTVLIRT